MPTMTLGTVHKAEVSLEESIQEAANGVSKARRGNDVFVHCKTTTHDDVSCEIGRWI
jgi:hypothetical protein